MAGGFLESSLAREPEGPDPNRLEGLLQFCRDRMDQPDSNSELIHHVGQMRSRIQETLRDRQGYYDGRRNALHADVSACIERNLQACRDIDAALEDFVTTGSAQALDDYERAFRTFFESSDQLTELARSSNPLCPACGSSGPEKLCPACSVDRLIPDSDFAEEDFDQAVVNEEFMDVFRAYQAAIEGRGTLDDLSQSLQPLEFSLLETQALVEQALSENPDDSDQQTLLTAVTNALEGVQRMHEVEKNRQARELNQGWVQVFRGAKAFHQVLPGLS
ncbi:hypothetical protein IV102_05040 [bacterium]|nr:hypothetical protein [bacterium]